jgi:catechol 2,3-dioxygenase-like lactoylglutathione lyase family enzyme
MTNDPTITNSAGGSEETALDGQTLRASLTVADIVQSLAWYRDGLGFVVDREFAREGRLMALSLRAGSVRILLTQDDGARGAGRVKGEGFSLSIVTTQDLNAIARRVAEYTGTGVAAEDSRFGRVLRLQDPDGFRLVLMPEPRT